MYRHVTQCTCSIGLGCWSEVDVQIATHSLICLRAQVKPLKGTRTNVAERKMPNGSIIALALVVNYYPP